VTIAALLWLQMWDCLFSPFGDELGAYPVLAVVCHEAKSLLSAPVFVDDCVRPCVALIVEHAYDNFEALVPDDRP
jgi:hypothetical protein